MTRIYDGVWDLVGGTPLVRLKRVVPHTGAEVLAKFEASNPSGSVKDRPARAMLEAAESEGLIGPGATVVEATSGNTGISLAMLCAVRGYRCVLVMPEDMASARQSILRAYGADMVLTSAELGMRGAVQEAERIVASTDNAFMPRQFENPANPRSHELTTATEIHAATEGKLDAVVAGVGTGGTISGIARGLRRLGVTPRVVAVEPKASPVLSGGQPALHAIQGLGPGFVPPVYAGDLVDQVMTVTDLEALRMATRLAKEEGLFVGPSSGANVHAALKVALDMEPGQRVVTVLCDTGERYC